MRILVEKTFTTEKKREHGEGVSYYEIKGKGCCKKFYFFPYLAKSGCVFD